MNKKVAKWGRFETKTVHLKHETAKIASFETKKRRYFVWKNPWDKTQKSKQDILHSISGSCSSSKLVKWAVHRTYTYDYKIVSFWSKKVMVKHRALFISMTLKYKRWLRSERDFLFLLHDCQLSSKAFKAINIKFRNEYFFGQRNQKNWKGYNLYSERKP